MTERPNAETVIIPARSLHRASTADLITQYRRAISSHAGRYTDTAPRQKRINLIVDMLDTRADAGDTDALAWFEEIHP
jgi:hypothetical protein